MEYNFIKTENKDNVGLIILNRPEALNTLNEKMLEEIADAAENYDKNPQIGAIIIQGSDKAFCAGLDVKEFSERINEFNNILETFKTCFIRIHKIKKPIIAAAAGYVLGIGAELLLCADVILATDSFRLALPEISLGMIPGLGVLNKLIRTIGKAKAMEMALCERAIMGDEAEKAGLISRIIPLPDLFEETYKTAKRAADAPQFAARAIKESVSIEENFENTKGIEDVAMRNKVIINTEEFRNYIRNFNKAQK